MKCKEVMTSFPTCCLPTDTSVAIAELMQSEDIGCVPILENKESRRIVGVVTDRDLALKVVAAGKKPATTKAKDIMTPDPHTCNAENDLQSAIEIMEHYQIRRIPIVDSDGRLSGIISQADIALRLTQPEHAGKVLSQISKPHVQ
ncbi:MAG: CBS domain-containing protein [Acidobacteria bacterium]|nr:CBS domain-containing protein [Acidobacteriota bacterium]